MLGRCKSRVGSSRGSFAQFVCAGSAYAWTRYFFRVASCSLHPSILTMIYSWEHFRIPIIIIVLPS